MGFKTRAKGGETGFIETLKHCLPGLSRTWKDQIPGLYRTDKMRFKAWKALLAGSGIMLQFHEPQFMGNFGVNQKLKTNVC